MRWRVDLEQDLRWWGEEVSVDAAWEGVMFSQALDRWSRWLATQYQRKLSGEKSTFPLQWRLSLLRTLRFAKEGGPGPAPAPPRRGAYSGQPQPVDVPTVPPADDPLASWRTS